MTASSPILEPELLAHLPPTLRTELIEAYAAILRNFRERRWEPSELNGGKLCEIVYCILQGHVSGSFPSHSSKPQNMVDACRALENQPTTFSRSVRIQVPRMLLGLYEIRNNRGVGHVGGDVNPNQMDATCVVELSKWLMSELVRMFHDVSTEEASAAVAALVQRTLPTVWKVGERLRVLNPELSMRDRTLLLLYHQRGAVRESDIFDWVEHSNASVYRRDVLRKSHKSKLVEYDQDAGTVEISPLGIDEVEQRLLGDA